MSPLTIASLAIAAWIALSVVLAVQISRESNDDE